MTVKINVDGRTLEAPAGANLLEACLEAGIYIPHLCHLTGESPPHASCRLCLVALDDDSRPVPACTVGVRDGLTVRTDTEEVRRLQRAGLRLLLSAHTVNCRQCPANRRCELQRMAKFLGMGLRAAPLPNDERPAPRPFFHPHLAIDTEHCVLCGRCVRTCRRRHGHALLTFAGRGFDTVVSPYPTGTDPTDIPCLDCLACIDVCPVGALQPRAPGNAANGS